MNYRPLIKVLSKAMPARFESDSTVMERFYKSHARHILRDQKATLNESTEATFPLGFGRITAKKLHHFILKTRLYKTKSQLLIDSKLTQIRSTVFQPFYY